LLPLAIEYAFWDERLPETLLRVGAPTRIASGVSTEAATQQLESALADAMRELKATAIARSGPRYCIRWGLRCCRRCSGTR
jgi:hypothetical protein